MLIAQDTEEGLINSILFFSFLLCLCVCVSLLVVLLLHEGTLR